LYKSSHHVRPLSPSPPPHLIHSSLIT
jgi:hypothetical protein